MSFFKPLFVIMYVSSFMMVMGGDSWFLLWMGLEVNMISFIILVYGKSIYEIEVCMKYFFIQGIGSAMLLMMLILSGKFLSECVILILSYKMGAGPFFFWFPSFCEGVSWASCILVMSLQKVIPLLFTGLFLCSFMWIMIFMSMFVGALGCFNESKLKKFMAFSSIHYVGWLFLCIKTNLYMWMVYLFGYMFMLVGILMSLRSDESISVKDILKMKSPGLFIFSMLNMGGMPPMLGFFLKWWVFLGILGTKIEVMWFIILLAVFMFYVYMRLVYPVLVNYIFMLNYSSYKMNSMSENIREWMYMVFAIFSPILGWSLL
uniref:NADH-ubiquinone oxidoreductase chain 2 n=2 Tax=Tetragnatha TaxID=27395 RepID=A0A2I6BYQ4_9ARAC|nr:NADH dehydrogenase subunit 2 [Tetragnatha sp. Rapa Nui]